MPLPDSEALLRVFEKKYRKTDFSEQTSSLIDLDNNLPKLIGKRLVDILALVNQEKGRVLEIGGGTKQIAALEIMEQYPDLAFQAVELRKIEPAILSQLKKYPQYKLKQTGVSQIEKIFPQAEFQLIFSHNVFEFLPDPLGTIEQLYSILVPQGHLMINKIPLYSDWWEKIFEYLSESQQVFGWNRTTGPVNMLKAGLYYYGLALEKQEHTLRFPVELRNEPITDFLGNALVTRQIEL